MFIDKLHDPRNFKPPRGIALENAGYCFIYIEGMLYEIENTRAADSPDPVGQTSEDVQISAQD